jgi:hypothetical protein
MLHAVTCYHQNKYVLLKNHTHIKYDGNLLSTIQNPINFSTQFRIKMFITDIMNSKLHQQHQNNLNPFYSMS